MHIEVDQSVKVEDPGDTILALSNNIDFAILIPDAVKNAAKRELSSQGISGPTRTLRIFSAALFLLLKDYLDEATSIIIDDEYSGRGNDITHLLLRLIWKVKSDFPKDRIEIRRITKKSLAHKKAWGTQQGVMRPNKVVKAGEFLKLL